jgi:hypothetical protein
MTRDEWERTSYDLADAVEDCFSPQAMKIIRNFIEVAADDFDKPRRAERGGASEQRPDAAAVSRSN